MEGNHFNCKEADHQNEQYESVCTNPDCQEQNKFFCAECCSVTNKHYLAEFNQGFIKRIKQILISKAPHLDFWKPIDKRIIEFYQQSVQQDVQQNNNDNDNEEIKIMKKSFNQMRNEINLKIDQMIQNQIIVLSKNNNNNNNQIKLIVERIVKNYDLLPLITAINQLKNGEITDNQANQQLKQFFSDQNRLTEGKQIILDSQFKSYKFEEQLFKNDLQPKILKQISELEFCLIDQRLKNQKQLIDLDFYSSKKNTKNSSSFQFEKETGIINIINIKTFNSRFEIYSSPFSRYKKVNFSFKILEYQPQYPKMFDTGLVFGIHAVKNDQNYSSVWGQNGNQIDLTVAGAGMNINYGADNLAILSIQTNTITEQLNSFGKFEVNGQLPSNIFSQGIEYDVQACVKDNLLIISDKENKSKITNQKKFENDDTNWVFVFNCAANLKIQIMKYVIN